MVVEVGLVVGTIPQTTPTGSAISVIPVTSFSLMKHPGVATILATGGNAMVEAAYSCGKPALGVGAGNVPAYVEKRQTSSRRHTTS